MSTFFSQTSLSAEPCYHWPMIQIDIAKGLHWSYMLRKIAQTIVLRVDIIEHASSCSTCKTTACFAMSVSLGDVRKSLSEVLRGQITDIFVHKGRVLLCIG